MYDAHGICEAGQYTKVGTFSILTVIESQEKVLDGKARAVYITIAVVILWP